MVGAPSGTVTFLFTDVVGSTRLWEEHHDAMRRILRDHDRILREATADYGGYVFSTAGDAFSVAFALPAAAIKTAIEVQVRFQAMVVDGRRFLVRMGVHTGQADERDGDYFGPVLNRCARLMSAGHGGQILASEITRSAVGATSDDFGFVDVGEHRLKDLGQPERIFQVTHPHLARDFPPLRTAPVVRTNVPSDLTSFVGRDDAIAELDALLATSRLVTLTGPGGVGKTRLAVEFARQQLDAYTDGIWLVDFAQLSHSSPVAEFFARTVGADAGEGGAMDRLLAFLARREMLVVPDNCEHVIGQVAPIVRALLQQADGIKLLATSRERLGLRGEQVLRLDPLPLPSSTDPRVRTNPNVTLFEDRARALSPGFSVTSANLDTICHIGHRLDGIPLAVELAAARTVSLTPEQVLSRLDDRLRFLSSGYGDDVPRHRTLEATIAWSYDLLDEGARAALRSLSVFLGSFDLDAAEHVASGGQSAEAYALDRIDDLVSKSLLVAERGRLRMLETIRSFAGKRLIEKGEEGAARRRHANYFAGFAGSLVGETFGSLSHEAADMLEMDHENLRSALRWGQENDELLFARLAAILGDFWFRRGHLVEGLQWLQRALEIDGPPEVRALVAVGAAQIAWSQADVARARLLCQLCLSIHASARGEVVTAVVEDLLGRIAYQEGDLDSAELLLFRSLGLFRSKDLQRWIGDAWHFLGHVARSRGDITEAARRHESAAVAFQRAGDDAGLGYALGARALDHWLAGDLEEGVRGFETSRLQLELAGDPRGVAESQVARAEIHIWNSEFEQAAQRLIEAIPVLLELGELRRLGGAVLLSGRLLHEAGWVQESAVLADVAEAAKAVPVLASFEDETAGVPEVDPGTLRAAASEGLAWLESAYHGSDSGRPGLSVSPTEAVPAERDHG